VKEKIAHLQKMERVLSAMAAERARGAYQTAPSSRRFLTTRAGCRVAFSTLQKKSAPLGSGLWYRKPVSRAKLIARMNPEVSQGLSQVICGLNGFPTRGMTSDAWTVPGF
jgi:hypothetical protein